MTQVDEHTRYDRQERIWGKEGQEKIAKAKVTIIGSGNCAKYTALPLAALGVGEIRIIGTGHPGSEEMFMDIPLAGSSRVAAYRNALQIVNPTIRILDLPMDLESRLGQNILEGSDIIVDTTNNPSSKALAFDYAKNRAKKQTVVLCAGVSLSDAKLGLYFPQNGDVQRGHFMEEYTGHEQGMLPSLLWGGVIAEEVKKCILGTQEVMKTTAYFKQGTRERFTKRKEGEPIPHFDKGKYQNLSVLVVGAGALGNIACLALAEMGVGRVDYIDPDTVESHNLNRQVLFYDAVGKEKAAVLAEKHMRMNPHAVANALVHRFEIAGGKYSIDALCETRYDLILDLVDNLYARAVISAYATQAEIPLISAASSPEAAQVATYVPGRSACMNHVFAGYYERGREEEVIRRQSCIAQPNPSVIITNQIAGALAAMEAMTIFDSEQFGEPYNGSLKYATQLDPRLGQNPIRDICKCHTEKQNIPNLEIAE